MKKIFTPILLLSGLALSGQSLFLTEVKCAPDVTAYVYNEQNLLDSMYVEEAGWNPHYDLYEYNQDGNVVLTKGYDNLSDNDFFCTSYVEYTYGENGKISTRKNYNSWDKGASFDIGGVLTYEYDEKNNLTKVVTSMPSWSSPDTFDPYQEDHYIYDELGRLSFLEIYTPDLFGGTGEFVIYNRLAYVYVGETNQISSITTFEYYDSEREVGKQEYVYDENGNVITSTIYKANSSGIYTKDTSFEYEYDLTTPISDICMPYDFEAPDYVHQNAKNKIVKKDWWALNLDNDQYSFFGTYNYTYSDNRTGGVETIGADKEAVLGVKVSVDGNRLFVSAGGDLTNKQVAVYDMSGRLMKTAIVLENGIDISLLRSGLYIVNIDGKGAKFVK